MDLSVVIPLYNETYSPQELYKTLKDTLDPLEKTYEIIFVDDGSTDNSFNILETRGLKE